MSVWELIVPPNRVVQVLVLVLIGESQFGLFELPELGWQKEHLLVCLESKNLRVLRLIELANGFTVVSE